MTDVISPFILSFVAGAATGLGGLIVLLLGDVSDDFMGLCLAFASGVMLVVSFLDLFTEALEVIFYLEATLAFSIGAIVMMILDLSLPHVETLGKRGRKRKGMRKGEGRGWKLGEKKSSLLNTGLLIALGVTLHNFPEGIIVSAGYAHHVKLGVLISVAIICHNIPEGMATAVLLSKAGLNRTKILLLTFLSGMPEPVAALFGSILLSWYPNQNMIGYLLAFAAGVMTYITAVELIPIAHQYGRKYRVSIGLLIGIIMGLLLETILL
jgi:ZIP family zinc transporter